MNTNDFIAVFDSGVGGISVLKHLVKLLPEERFLYFGDSANAPYGTKTKETVRELTLAAAEMLYLRGIKALVVACNTATSAAINDLRLAYPDLIVIGIEPALKLAADTYPGGRLGVMATPMTLREEKFSALMERFQSGHEIFRIPAPGLVELIESGRGDSPEAQEFLHSLLDEFVGKLDALVLGCTHYPFVKRNISAILGPGVEILHGGQGTARETKRRLGKAGLLREGTGDLEIINSAQDRHLLDLCRKLLEQA